MTVIKIDDEIGIWGITSSSISRQLDEANGDIEIHISSPGGAIFEGVSIFNSIKAYNKGHVTTIITSIAASMASVIALAGDTIKAYDNSVYMIHNASMVAWGDAEYFRKKANHLESLTNMLAKNYIDKSGKSDKEIKQLLDDETYFYGSEILEAGFIDEIIATEIDGDSESAKLLANENFKSCMANYRENAKDEENDQIAALLKEDNPTAETTETKALAKNKNLTQGNVMTEKELQALRDDHAEALTGTALDATNLEKDRCSGIIALNGNAEFTAKAITDGTTVGDAAIALLKNQGDALSKKKADFEESSQELEEQNEGETTDEKLSAEQKLEKEADKALDEHFDGGK